MGESHTMIAQMLTISIGLGCFGILTTIIGLFTMSWYMHQALRELAEVLRDRR